MQPKIIDGKLWLVDENGNYSVPSVESLMKYIDEQRKENENLVMQNDLLKNKIKLIETSPRSQFLIPTELGKKYFSNDFEQFNTRLRHKGCFIDNTDINNISVAIRAVCFGRFLRKTGKGNGTTTVKRIDEMTSEEYRIYYNCMDELLAVFQKYRKECDTEYDLPDQ